MKSNVNYRIFRIEEQKNSFKPKKVTMKKICALSLDDAYEKLKEYRDLANKQYKYYVEAWSPYRIVGKDGKVREYDDWEDSFKEEHAKQSIFKKLWDKISIECWRIFIDIPHDIQYWFRDVFYFIKHKQYYRASWNLDWYLLETIEHNVPILLKNKHGISPLFLDKVRIDNHKDDKNFDIDEYNKNNTKYTEDEEKEAIKLEQESLNELLLAVRLYKYYTDKHIYIDPKDTVYVEIDKKYRSSLPLIKGSYDSYEWPKLNNMAKRQWNKIWDWMRQYGEILWD